MQNTACDGYAQLTPCIAELLRTCVKPASLLLRIEHIVPAKYATGHLNTDNEGPSPNRPSRLFLTDDVLTIQALLHPQLHLGQSHQTGDLLKLAKFELKKARRLNATGKIVYLAIEDCEVVHQQRIEEHPCSSESAGGFVREGSNESRVGIPIGKRKRSLNGLEPSPESKRPSLTRDDHAQIRETSPDMELPNHLQDKRRQLPVQTTNDEKNHDSTGSGSDSDFETIKPDTKAVHSRRQALHRLNPPTVHSSNQSPSLQHTSQVAKAQLALRTLPFHTLASLLDPPSSLPRKSYMCSILAIITWVSASLIHRPNSPFPPKRHIKIHDISIRDRHAGVTLAVFVDAMNFKPHIGTIALFRGVVMHRWENDVILNAYQNLGSAEDGWYITDQEQIKDLGHDTSGLEQWWSEKNMGTKMSQF